MPMAPRSILLTNLQPIGDILMTTPMLRALRRAYPQARIEMIVQQSAGDILKGNPHLDRVITIERHGAQFNLSQLLRIAARLPFARYDLALSLHRFDLCVLLCLLSGAKHRAGFYYKTVGRLLTQPIEERLDLHKVRGYLEILLALGLPAPEDDGLDLWIDGPSEQSAAQRWHAAGLDEAHDVIGMNPGGGWSRKRWPAERFAELAVLLKAHGMLPVLFGGMDDEPLAREIAARCGDTLVQFTGQLSLLELAVLLRKCRVLVSADSGPMHIAASQQVPIVALFGTTDPQRYAPYRSPHVIVSAAHTCSHMPCWRTEEECADTPPRCMSAITAERVFGAIQQLTNG